jgi:hypothetical protein
MLGDKSSVSQSQQSLASTAARGLRGKADPLDLLTREYVVLGDSAEHLKVVRLNLHISILCDRSNLN